MTVAAGTVERSRWRSVALPAEHGGWGLTLEPVLLGLLIAPSSAGLALGVAALLAFLVRTPLKLTLVDRRRGRWLDRSRLALRIALVELAAMVILAGYAVWSAGWMWLWPVLAAVPLVAVETWFDIRSRGRRLVPELCGAAGIGAVVAAMVIAGDGDVRLAVGAWAVLAGRAVGAIPFVRVQIMRLRRGEGSVGQSDVAQVVALAIGAGAVALDHGLLGGLLGLAVLAGLQTRWTRRPPSPAKVLGMRQMAMGFGLVAITAIGVALT